MAEDAMKKDTLSFPEQFQYDPKVENAVGQAIKFDKFAFVGMGGSGLIGEIIRMIDPGIDLVIRKGYGLPGVKDLSSRLMICVSYSGNTEETLGAFEEGLKEGLNLAVISTGGELLKRAKEVGVLYVELPKTGIQPRVSIGLQLKAALKLMDKEGLSEEVEALSEKLDAEALESQGASLAEKLSGKVPIIYSSRENLPLAYNWKIKFNETGKIPAFYNVFSELNHNEMIGFDVNEGNRDLSKNMAIVLLKDDSDEPRMKKRMELTEKLLIGKGLTVYPVELSGGSKAERFFSSAILADWASYHIALANASEPNEVKLIEDFKKQLND